MPTWTQISLPDLQEARAAKLVEALRTKALAEGQPDPLPGATQKAVLELRNAIAFSGAYTLDADAASIPPALKDMAVQRIVRLLKGRLLQPYTEAEKEEDKLWQRRLEQLTAGKWPVDATDNPLLPPPVQTAAASPRIVPRTREFTRAAQSGL